MLLMEVMPNLLAKRVFHSVMTKKLIEPGYREAPDPREPMTIMFVKVIMMLCGSNDIDMQQTAFGVQDAHRLCSSIGQIQSCQGSCFRICGFGCMVCADADTAAGVQAS